MHNTAKETFAILYFRDLLSFGEFDVRTYLDAIGCKLAA